MAFLHPPDERKAIGYEGREISYAEVHAGIARLARALGTDVPERVAILSENRPEWIFALYAGWHRGATVVPIDVFSSADEVRFILGDCEPGVVFCSEERRELAEEASAGLAAQPRIVTFESIASVEDEVVPFREPELDRTALLIYTSGTTGEPKGVMLSFGNLEANRGYVERIGIYNAMTRVLAVLPLHHTFPLQGCVVAPLSVGGLTAIVEKPAAETIVEALGQHRITMVIGVPRLYELLHRGILRKIRASVLASALFALSRRIDRIGFSRRLFGKVHRAFGGHIEYLISGGARLDPAIHRDFRHLGFEVLEGYGLTETAPMISYSPPGRVKVGSVGIAIDGCELRIVDGEIVVRGPNVMQGYFRRPEATAEVLDENGWFRTGDLGAVDDDGYLTITGRKKELIVLPNGKNIQPEPIETQIAERFALVHEIGVYEAQGQLAAIVVPSRSAARDQGIVDLPGEVRRHVVEVYNRDAADHRRIHRISLVENDLPRTRLGKLRRFALPELARDAEAPPPRAEEPRSREYSAIRRYLVELRGTEVRADEHLELDLALDSLDKVELLVYLERTFGVSLDVEALSEHRTPRALAELMEKLKTRLRDEDLDWRDILSEDVPVSLPKRVFLLTVFKWIFRPLSRLYFRIEIDGLDNLPERGSCIITPNHQSHLDGLLVATALRARTLRRTYFFAKEKHFRSWWRRLFASNANIIVMNINRELKASVQKIASVLRSGRSMVIFPEGTRSVDGRVAPFKKTFAILSKELEVPVVPVAIRGAFASMSAGSWLPKPAKIHLRFLEPISPEGHDYHSLSALTRSVIEEAI